MDNFLTNVGPKTGLCATPSVCLQSFPLKMKCESRVARDKSSLNSDLVKLFTVSHPLKSSFVQISVISFKVMLVNSKSTPTLALKKSSC